MDNLIVKTGMDHYGGYPPVYSYDEIMILIGDKIKLYFWWYVWGGKFEWRNVSNSNISNQLYKRQEGSLQKRIVYGTIFYKLSQNKGDVHSQNKHINMIWNMLRKNVM